MFRNRRFTEHVLRCSFCGKRQSEVKTLIAGPGVYICNECVLASVAILIDGDPEPEPNAPHPVETLGRYAF